jgi:hypothetical protein
MRGYLVGWHEQATDDPGSDRYFRNQISEPINPRYNRRRRYKAGRFTLPPKIILAMPQCRFISALATLEVDQPHHLV